MTLPALLTDSEVCEMDSSVEPSPSRSEAERGLAEAAPEWCLVSDDKWIGPVRYAARVLRSVVKSRAYILDRWGEEKFVKASRIVVRGLTEEAAKRASEQLASSVALYEQETKAALTRARERTTVVLMRLRGEMEKPG